MIIEVSFDIMYQCGFSTPHLIVNDQETFLKIISCIPDGRQFHVGYIEGSKITGRGTYMADKDYVFIIREEGTCQLDTIRSDK